MFTLPQDYHLDYTKRNSYILSLENNLTKFLEVVASIDHSDTRELLEHLATQPHSTIIHFFAHSPYLSDGIIKHPTLLSDIHTSSFKAVYDTMMADLLALDVSTVSLQELMTILRQNKQKIALLIALADFTAHWKLEDVTEHLSYFAQICVQITSRYLLLQAHIRGEIALPDIQTPEKQSGLVIVAMGKLGARELNYSSDIDIIVFYDHEQCDYRGRKTLKHFYINIANQLAKILTERTQDGYVFRTDLRLRPDPMANPVALSLRSAEHYYETLGQNWERAAMIKARTIAGDPDSCERFNDMIHYFIWRRSLDFASIKDIHSIKRQINHKLVEPEQNFHDFNVKLGHGGIREIEFFAQTQQLIWGGRLPHIQERKTCQAIHALTNVKQVNPTTALLLCDAYHFLRKIEHRLQMINDQQTHSLPSNDDDMEKIADFMGFKNVSTLLDLLEQKTYSVKKYYSRLFESEPSLTSQTHYHGNLVFTGMEDDPDTLSTLRKMGYKNPSQISAIIRGWHHGRRRATRSKKSREILTELMPTLLDAFAKSAYPDKAFTHFDSFLDRIPSGAQIFSLLQTHPDLLSIVSEILALYPYLIQQLNKNPSLLDYVIVPGFYDQLPSKNYMRRSLRDKLSHADDLEDALDITRDWTNDRRFRVAILYIRGYINYEDVANSLSDIADISTGMLMDVIYDSFVEQYGTVDNSQFAILAFGKLGGRELTFNSDLDLVFLYNTQGTSLSNGKTQLDANTYFIRLARRFTTYVSSSTRSGTLYDVDLRLRPSGNDGPVATSLDAFLNYYKNDAWMWEYMALTKTRCTYERHAEDGGHFTHIIHDNIAQILTRSHPKDKLMHYILDMHEKTIQIKHTDNPLNLKYHRGGTMDIEYIAQTLLLLHAPGHPEIMHNNTITALENLLTILPDYNSDLQILIDAYNFYRALLSYLRLTGNNRPLESELSPAEKKLLVHHTQEKDFPSLRKKLIKIQTDVTSIFDRIMHNNNDG